MGSWWSGGRERLPFPSAVVFVWALRLRAVRERRCEVLREREGERERVRRYSFVVVGRSRSFRARRLRDRSLWEAAERASIGMGMR